LDDLMASYTNAGAPDALLVRKFCDPWSVFSPSMASFLKRTANASFVPRLLSDRSFYATQWRVIGA
jgi:hypothetical protein